MSSATQNSIHYKSNFKKIIEVFVFHEYYTSRNCSTIDFVLDQENRLLIRNYGLLFKQTGQGFVVLQSVDSKTTSASFSGPVTFEFDMVFKDPLFLSLTNMPFQYNQFLNFTNEKAAGEQLHEAVYVGENDIQPYAENGIAGKVTLTINHGNEFFGQDRDGSNVPTFQYKINFDARTFVLRYNFYFTTKPGDIKKYYVLNEKDGTRYENFVSRKLENGIEAFSLVLSDEIKLQEKYKFLLYLKKEDEFDKSFSKFLPHPEPKNLSFDPEKKVFFNDLFISLQ